MPISDLASCLQPERTLRAWPSEGTHSRRLCYISLDFDLLTISPLVLVCKSSLGNNGSCAELGGWG